MNSYLASAGDRLRPQAAPGNTAGTGLLLSGLHQIEPDFAERGIWVERHFRIAARLSSGGKIGVTGLYFPKLIAAQNGSSEMLLRFFIGGEEVHATTLRQHGPFSVEFTAAPEAGGDGELLIACDRCFVPAQIGDGSDQRELCWRMTSLRAGNTSLFDCTRQFNFFFGPVISAALNDSDESSLRFHLDSPLTGLVNNQDNGFVVSGWACDVASCRAASVRVAIGRQILHSHSIDRGDVQSVFASQCRLPLNTGFSLFISPPVGVLSARIDAQTNSGDWAARQQGFVISAPATGRAPGGKLGYWLTRALPQAVRSLAQDHFRTITKDPREAHLPGMFRFHLDAPKVDETNVVTAECLVSGWAFDEQECEAVPVRVVIGQSIFPVHAKQREDVQKAFGAIGPLPLNTGFACVLTLPVGYHRLRVEVQGLDGFWVAVRRARVLRLPGIHRGSRAAPKLSFRAYMRLQRRHQLRELPEVLKHIEVMPIKPMFVVIVKACSTGSEMRATLRSIREQTYSRFDIRIVANGQRAPLSDGASFLEDPDDFIIFLRSGQHLASRAMYEFASAINQYPDIDLIYADETVEAQGNQRSVPFYKPDWSPDYLETFNYIGSPACYRASLAAECLKDVQSMSPYDFVLRFTERTPRILHLALILAHDPSRFGERHVGTMRADAERQVEALTGRLARTGRRGTVTEYPTQKGCFSISLRLARTPLVSIVIPTAGKTITLGGREIDLIVNVVEHLRHRSSYKNIEIVIIDNGDLSAAQIEALDRAGCKRTTYTEPVFNISKKLNQGAQLAAGELLLLMNDDIEILTPDWIDRMLAHFEKPHAGVVGAKLLYPDGKTQHVGVVHNSGNPDHVRRLFPRDDGGYFFSTCGVRNFCAVTGACMMVRAEVYRAVGGYTEALAVSYNDADFCLKVGQLGLSVIYSPDVELTHMESQSRVASADRKEVNWYHTRWAADIVSDRFYSERFLTVASPTFVPCINERLV